jgi:SWI/SNF-related matrix-associated actin-dependent regulator of chromatin subfamily A member 5
MPNLLRIDALIVTGMDLDDEGVEDNGMDEEEADEQEGENAAAAQSTEKSSEKASEENEKYEQEIRKERAELLEAQQTADLEAAGNADEKFHYLMKQSDVFAHFLAGSVAAETKKNKRKKGVAKGGGRGRAGRMTEEAEDAALVKTAQSKRKVVRVEHQPKILSAHCKMHDYQLEGLNWLIRLHDNGINGILADEMVRKYPLHCIKSLEISLPF